MNTFSDTYANPIVLSKSIFEEGTPKAELLRLWRRGDRSTPQSRSRQLELLDIISEEKGPYERQKLAGTVFMIDGQLQDTLISDRFAVSLATTDDERAEGWGNVGNTLGLLKEWQGALRAGESSLRYGDTPGGWTALVSGLAGVGDFAAAGKAFLQACRRGGAVRSGLLQTVTTPGNPLAKKAKRIREISDFLAASL